MIAIATRAIWTIFAKFRRAPFTQVNEAVWSKCDIPLSFEKTISGKPITAHGQLWRRMRNGEWEYRQDAETMEEYDARIY